MRLCCRFCGRLGFEGCDALVVERTDLPDEVHDAGAAGLQEDVSVAGTRRLFHGLDHGGLVDLTGAPDVAGVDRRAEVLLERLKPLDLFSCELCHSLRVSWVDFAINCTNLADGHKKREPRKGLPGANMKKQKPTVPGVFLLRRQDRRDDGVADLDRIAGGVLLEGDAVAVEVAKRFAGVARCCGCFDGRSLPISQYLPLLSL